MFVFEVGPKDERFRDWKQNWYVKRTCEVCRKQSVELKADV